jgi:hypothetical protein
MADIEESVAGFKRRGDWGDVVEHGEQVTRALREAGLGDADDAGEDVDDVAGEPDDPPAADADYEAAFAEWEEWRPKAHERIDDDVSEKTAEQASVAEGEGEQAGAEPGEDVKTAGEKLAESYEHLEEGDDEGAVGKWQDSVKYAGRAADSAARRAVRKVEDTVYKRVMTQLAPYYFDNDLVSANLQKTTRGEADEQFVFEVNVNDDELRDFLAERLYDYDDAVDRWHVDTEKQTAAVEAAEGVEPPAEDNDGQSRSTRN